MIQVGGVGYLTTAEAAKRLGVTEKTLHLWRKAGKLSAQRLGKKLLFDARALDSLLKPA